MAIMDWILNNNFKPSKKNCIFTAQNLVIFPRRKKTNLLFSLKKTNLDKNAFFHTKSHIFLRHLETLTAMDWILNNPFVLFKKP